MTPMKESVDNLAVPIFGAPVQSARALDICRGVGRLLSNHGLVCVSELPLPNGRRADMVGLSERGDIWIVEVKSSVEDFRSDQKWPEYREFCDRLFFAVSPEFPADILPSDTGLVFADRYGGEIVRQAPEWRLPGSRRRSMTLRFARAAAARLSWTLDPSCPD